MATKKQPPLTETSVYSEILKYEEQEDGTLLVYGKATDDTLDSDQQICDPVWLDTAMPEWFKYGNIREQHSNIAAGVAVEYEKTDGGHFITAAVVDPNSVKKVKSRVLKGFSIGIKGPRVVRDNKAAGGRIVDGQIVEVSLVDRPANPSCTLTLAKSADSGDLVQVEELDVVKGETVEAEIETPEVGKADELVAMAKQINVDVEKFDAAAYRTARAALAQLISVEAGELADGHDERMSLAHLLGAVHNLLCWFEGEEDEGEVTEEEESSLELAAEPDLSKCLECGCHLPGESHGDEDVTTAEVVEAEKALDEEMCDKCNESMKMCKCSDEKAASVDLESMVADIVKSLLPATDPRVDEEAVTKATAAEERIKALEAEIAQVKALAAPGGPRRLGVVSTVRSENLVKAAAFRAKADATLDQQLAEGYRALAADLEKTTSGEAK